MTQSTSSKTKTIREKLESDFHENYSNKPHQNRKQKNYQGLGLNWKDAVILSMVFFFTGLYHSQAHSQTHNPIQNQANDTTQEELFDLSDIESGMMLNYHPETNNYSSISLLSSEYDVDIKGIVAYVTIKQSFHNKSSNWIDEGMYAFPIEHTGAVHHMRLKIGQRLIEGEIHEKKQAQRIYDEAKSSGLTASIVKQHRPNLFTTEVANIMPDEVVEVEIQYQQILRYDNGVIDFRLPLKIKPRYVAESPDETLLSSSKSTSTITESLKRTVRIKLEAGFELNQLKSKYHTVNIDDFGITQEISFTDTLLEDANDFVLQWQPRREQAPQAAFFSEHLGGEKYVLAMFLPPQSTTKREQSRELVFIIDTSGSMHGEAINQAKDALLFAMTQLSAQDSFNIIEFNSHARELFSETQKANPDNLSKAIDFIDSLISTGGTHMAPALSLAMNDSIKPDHLKQIIFITDGSVGNEADLFKQIEQDIGDARLFTVAIGAAPNDYFMSKSSEIGRGTYTHVADLNEVDESMSQLFKKLSHPAMTDIHIDWKQKVAQSPKVIPDLYLDQPLFVTAKMPISDKTIELQGARAKSLWSQKYEFNQDGRTAGVAKLWARKQIDDLTDDYMLNTSAYDEDIKQQITELALKFNLVSEFTSLVAVDKNPDLSRLIERQAKALKSNQNVDFASYPQTFNGWKLQMLFGLLLIFVALKTRRGRHESN